MGALPVPPGGGQGVINILGSITAAHTLPWEAWLTGSSCSFSEGGALRLAAGSAAGSSFAGALRLAAGLGRAVFAVLAIVPDLCTTKQMNRCGAVDSRQTPLLGLWPHPCTHVISSLLKQTERLFCS